MIDPSIEIEIDLPWSVSCKVATKALIQCRDFEAQAVEMFRAGMIIQDRKKAQEAEEHKQQRMLLRPYQQQALDHILSTDNRMIFELHGR